MPAQPMHGAILGKTRTAAKRKSPGAGGRGICSDQLERSHFPVEHFPEASTVRLRAAHLIQRIATANEVGERLTKQQFAEEEPRRNSGKSNAKSYKCARQSRAP